MCKPREPSPFHQREREVSSPLGGEDQGEGWLPLPKVGVVITLRLMPIQCDYHMHTPLCKHAQGPMEAYVERGIELGLREIGFSDHNPLPNRLSNNVRME